MLVHIPAYALKEELDYYELKTYLVQVGTAINSYFSHGNDTPLLVTTNSEQIRYHVDRLRENSGYEFEILKVSDADLNEVFPPLPNDGFDYNNNYKKFFQSKFYPMMKRMDDHIIHVDYDIIFMRKIDFSELAQKDITLIRYRDDEEDEWINSGFFSVQNGGFDLIEKEFVQFYVENPSDQSEVEKYRWIPEEFLFNKMYHEKPDSVYLTEDYTYNFPAFNLQSDPNWTKSAKCVHYHHVKAASCYLTEQGTNFYQDHGNIDFLHRINKDFYKSLLIFNQHLFEANRFMDNVVNENLLQISESRLGELMNEHFSVHHYRDLCH